MEKKGEVIPCRESKTEKVWKPTVESCVQGIWRLTVSETEWRV